MGGDERLWLKRVEAIGAGKSKSLLEYVTAAVTLPEDAGFPALSAPNRRSSGRSGLKRTAANRTPPHARPTAFGLDWRARIRYSGTSRGETPNQRAVLHISERNGGRGRFRANSALSDFKLTGPFGSGEVSEPA